MSLYPVLLTRRRRGGFALPYTLDLSVDGALPDTWVGATWAISGGVAINTPTLGSNINDNPGFDADSDWEKGTGWTIDTGIATHAGDAGLIQSSSGAAVAANTVYLLSMDLANLTSWVLPNLGAVDAPLQTTDGSKVINIITSAPTNRVLLFAAAGADLDNFTTQALTTSTIFAYLNNNLPQIAEVQAKWSTVGNTHGGVVGWWDKATALQNCLVAYHNGANLIFKKIVGTTQTALVSAAAAYSANAAIKIVRTATDTFQAWYNGTQYGGDQTVSDAEIISNGYHGLYSGYAGNQCSEFTIPN